MDQLAHFPKDLRDGRTLGEDRVQAWLAKRYWTGRATKDQQRRGIDLVARASPSSPLRTVEVKVQRTSSDSFFVETHGGGLASPGWALTTEADWLALCDAGTRFCIWLRPSAVRDRLERWTLVYGSRMGSVPAKGRARGRGIPVPWPELHHAGRLYWLTSEPPDIEEVEHAQEESKPARSHRRAHAASVPGSDR